MVDHLKIHKTAAENTEFQQAYRSMRAGEARMIRSPLSLIDAIAWDLRVFFFKLRFRKELAMTDQTLL
jgi:hypothetical protein